MIHLGGGLLKINKIKLTCLSFRNLPITLFILISSVFLKFKNQNKIISPNVLRPNFCFNVKIKNKEKNIFSVQAKQTNKKFSAILVSMENLKVRQHITAKPVTFLSHCVVIAQNNILDKD